ncbi:uncharacterized protein EAE97_001856 [Botrytis byssoidea]|uniref:Major facilitator superfamily (MFS) profile domain-containing protein n=1 Tax=Botrytis byssoidea TaxID=139641 RepID=A0A9P5IYV3_9HELO|nr:uncharacterized protein EAE97_001856 [Botrytis byssoidea]KAF7952359.1 hypothetical protein EAE97_001856 [Botrytis byssoidea]
MHAEKKNNLKPTISAPSIDDHTITPSNGFSENPPPEIYFPDDKRDNNDIDPEQAQAVAHPETGAPPDGGYGWVYVLCVFLINAHTWGINSSYGIFLAHYLETNTFPGASDLDFAFVGGLSLSMAQFIAPVATITTREWGMRATLTIGIILQTAALLGASWSTEIWQLFLSQGLCFGLGMRIQSSATVGIISQWFDRRRSLANGMGTAGSGIGGLIYSLASSALIQRWGTGWAFRILAIASAAACGLSATMIKDRNKAIGAIQVAFHTGLLKRPEFLLTLVWDCLSVLGSILGAMFNLGGGVGRPVIGYISDDFGRINTALVCTFLAGLFSLAVWIFAKSFGILIFYALIGGAVSATFTTTVAPVGAEVVGLPLLPSALSIFWVSVVIPSTFAEPIALWLRTKNGTNFLHAQIFTGFMYMGATISLWLVRTWKISEFHKTDTDDAVNYEARVRGKVGVPQDSMVAQRVGTVPSVMSKVKSSCSKW